jgi:hypothetical protein
VLIGVPNSDSFGPIATTAVRNGRATATITLPSGGYVGQLEIAAYTPKSKTTAHWRKITVRAAESADMTTIDLDAGTVGALRLGTSTEQDVIAALGSADDRQPADLATALVYRCGQQCDTSYWIANKTGRLMQVITSDPTFITTSGTTPHTPMLQAQRQEKGKLVGQCGSDEVRRSTATGQLDVTLDQGWVSQISLQGPASALVGC